LITATYNGDASFAPSTSPPLAQVVNPIFSASGKVMSASNPINGSVVTLYQAGSTGGTATSLGSATSDPTGAFSIALTTAPSPTAILYVVATGGDAGGGSNTAIALTAVIGLAGSGTSVTATVNELTTVAAAYVLSNFITTESNLADNSFNFLSTAVNTIGNLVNIQTGALGPIINNANNDPSRFDTLANALANCVRATSAATACTNLFAAANSPTAPSDTLGAIININKSPVNNTSTIFGLASGGPYAPALAGTPTDWVIELKYNAGGQLDGPVAIAVDRAGNIWVANCGPVCTGFGTGNGSLTELSSSGIPMPGSPFTGGGLDAPFGVAIDGSGNVWAINVRGDSVTKLNSSGTPVPGSPFTAGGLNGPSSIAIDSIGNAWVANGNDSVTELNSSGAPLPGSPFTGGGLNAPSGIAIDGSGNVWVSNGSNNSVTELNSSGVPVSGSPFTGGGLSMPIGIAIDNSGNLWAANFTPACGSGDVTELTVSGVPISAACGFTGGGLSTDDGLAIDGLSNVWVSNPGFDAIAEINSVGIAVSPTGGFAVGIGGGGGNADPERIGIDPSGNIWVANQDTNEIVAVIGAGAPVKTPLAPPSAPKMIAPPNAIVTVSGSLGTLVGLTTDGLNLYTESCSTGSCDIVSAPITGGATTTLYTPGAVTDLVSPIGLTVTGTSLYWVDPNSGVGTGTQILSAPSGGGLNTLVEVFYDGFSPLFDGDGITTDGGNVYVSDEDGGNVFSIGVSGGSLTQLNSLPLYMTGAAGFEHHNGIAVDRGILYLSDTGFASPFDPPQIVSIPITGTSFTTLFQGAPLVCPSGVTAANGVLFVTDPCANNTVWELPQTVGGNPFPVLTGHDAPFVNLSAITFFNDVLYLGDGGSGIIYRYALRPGG
jgi:hypothetical protein